MAGYEEDAPDYEAPEETFSKAFAKNRKAGKKEFSWKNPKTGKTQTYTTRYKEEESDDGDNVKKSTMSAENFGKSMQGKSTDLNLPKTEKLDLSELTGPRRTRFAMADYYAKNPEKGAKTGEIAESLIGPKAKAAAATAAAGFAGYGIKKARDYLMNKAASARKTAMDVTKGDLAQARSAAARSAEADAWAERIKNARSAPGMTGYKKGGSVKSSASKRADGIAQRGKTRGKIC
jgi:hypothetical protein